MDDEAVNEEARCTGKLHSLLSSPRGNHFQKQDTYVEVLEHQWSARRAREVEDRSPAREKNNFSCFLSYLYIFWLRKELWAKTLMGKHIFFGQTKPKEKGENAFFFFEIGQCHIYSS